MKTTNLFLILGLGMLYSFSSCSKLEGDVSMTYTKATAIYGDIDSLRNVPMLESSRNIENPIGFYVGKDYVLVGERGKGIHIFEDLNLNNPNRKSFIQIPFNKEFYVKDNMLYAESGYDLLKIDISDIEKPRLISRVKYAFGKAHYNDRNQLILGFDHKTVTENFKAESRELKEIKKNRTLYVDYKKEMIPLSTVPAMFTGDNGKSKGTMNRISVYKNYVYVASFDKLHIFSNSSPTAAMTKIGDQSIAENTETIYASQHKLFLGSESEMTIYSDGASPRKLGSLTHEVSCDPILPVNNIAYFTLRSVANDGCNADGENTLSVVNITSPSRPRLIESHTLKSPYGISLINNYLFVGEGRNGLTIFDAKKQDDIKHKITIENMEAFDITSNPFDDSIVIITTRRGIQQYRVNWNTLSFTLLNQLNYKT